jgi:O-antigen/teichoic acid export membrane protein
MLSAADAGVYVAAYGLASIPFMIVNGTAEQALRPVYQQAVSSGDQPRANGILRIWLLVVIGCCLLGVLIFASGNRALAGVFLGKSYRQAAPLMPGIALGYAIRASSYVFERVCYAYGRTHRVLITQLCAVSVAAVVTPLAVMSGGVRGAALAVPVYFSIQLLLAVLFARRTLREAVLPGIGSPMGRFMAARP